MTNTTTRKLEPVASVAADAAYQAQKTSAPIDLKLDANERVPPIEFPVDWGNVSLQKYPDKTILEKRIASRFNIEPSQVIVTCGGDEAIDRVCRTFLASEKSIVVPTPTFAMIKKYARATGAEIRETKWLAGQFPVDNVASLANDSTSVISIVSPNNPTGLTISTSQLKTLAEKFPAAILLVDAAYCEFEDSPESLTQTALQIPNAIIIRTFSKAFGLAGLRIGYALGSTEVIGWLRRTGGPYPATSCSLEIAGQALRNETTNAAYIDQVKRERTELFSLLQELEAKPLPSQANFIFARFPDEKRSASFVCEALASIGISVRSFENMPDALRITCPGNEPDFQRLTQSLRAALIPEAILFDMDGVLVDEAISYREAIRQTCESFGQTVTMEEIAETKLSGDANSDWVCTRRILLAHGADHSLEEVTERFESIYQGDGDAPGLWQLESPTIDPEWLAKLADRYPLAIVTGRPRRDALRFLETFELKKYFSAIICLEDGPAKPNPANVNTALKQLNVSSAWMIGDTPDDINAARSARVIPFGIVAPQDDQTIATTKFNEAFAVRILDSLSQLEEYLP